MASKFAKPWVEFVGEVDEVQKNELLRNAYALLFPIDWPEPFGLVMVEAMSCGTPVIAWGHGSVPEIVDDGATGFIVNSLPGALRGLHRVAQLERRRVAKIARERFSIRRMTLEYLRLYEHCIALQTMPVLNVATGGGLHAGPRK
ncbi:MAG: glycosyltransferase [Myxococcales bacterium]